MASERLHEALAGLSTLTTAAQQSLTRLYHTLEETIHSEDRNVVAKPWVHIESNLIEVQAQEQVPGMVDLEAICLHSQLPVHFPGDSAPGIRIRK